jgi:hypothetical protein
MNVILRLLLLAAWQTDSNELWLGISSAMRFCYIMDEIQPLPMMQVLNGLLRLVKGLRIGRRYNEAFSSRAWL